MCDECFRELYDIIVVAKVNSIDTLEILEKILGILSTCVVMVGGILGIGYIGRLKENDLNATFGYCSRLKVYIKQIQEIFKQLGDDFYERMLPQNKRKEVESSHNDNTKALMTILVNTSRATLDFLKNSEGQFPSSADWNDKINILLDFLISCDRMEFEEEYIWNERNDNKYKEYSEKNLDNFQGLIDAIDGKIEFVEKKLYKKRWWQFWKKR